MQEVEEAARGIAMMLVLFGLPLGTWAHMSLVLDLERRIKQCGECATCKAKEADRLRIKRENAARLDKVCVKGHGRLNDSRTCNVCGWS